MHCLINNDGSIDRWESKESGSENKRRDILLVYKDSHFNLIGPELSDVQPEENGRLTDGAFAKLVANNTKAASEAEELGDY